ncbi:MAG TPA: phosphoglycerate dehydrogenase [Planococcus sp. (in: firmicutes)]|nr:phosphoglycerate dehydrogenase [Planococcus sp. (in: firmicutes)]
MKILLMLRDPFYEANPDLLEELKNFGEVKILYTDNGISKEELKQAVEDVDIILVAVVKIDQEVIDAAPNLKYILKYGAGYDNIDAAYAHAKGISVTNAPGLNAQSAADHAFGLMLSAARQIPRKNEEMKRGHWQLSMGNEIHGKTLGIVGFGSIGQALAKRATGFDMKTIVYTNYKEKQAAVKLNAEFVDKDRLFQESDFIIIATSLNDNNRHLVNKETLAIMKPTAFLINISRGSLVCEKDLQEALESGRISGAALDVFESEPTKSELAKMDRVIATPHIGGATYESISRIGDLSVSNIQRFIEGKELKYKVK